MTSVEHSILVFLLDAIEVCPDKAPDLLFLAGRDTRSEDYKNIIYDLQSVQSNQELVRRLASEHRMLLRKS